MKCQSCIEVGLFVLSLLFDWLVFFGPVTHCVRLLARFLFCWLMFWRDIPKL
jgi:hypothetical protein